MTVSLLFSGFWLPVLSVPADAIRPDACLEILTTAGVPVARLQAEVATTTETW